MAKPEERQECYDDANVYYVRNDHIITLNPNVIFSSCRNSLKAGWSIAVDWGVWQRSNPWKKARRIFPRGEAEDAEVRLSGGANLCGLCEDICSVGAGGKEFPNFGK